MKRHSGDNFSNNKNDLHVLFGKEEGSEKRDSTSFIKRKQSHEEGGSQVLAEGDSSRPALEFNLQLGGVCGWRMDSQLLCMIHEEDFFFNVAAFTQKGLPGRLLIKI